MTQQEIIEGNRLIAEFMGWIKVTAYNGIAWDMPNIDKYQMSLFGNLVDAKENGKYHSSWDWLMPVLKRINETLFTDYEEAVWGQWAMIFSPTKYPIERVHEQAVYFIKWHASCSE